MTAIQIKAFWSIILGSAFIAFAPIFVRISEVGPVASGFWRMGLSILPMIIIAKIINKTDNYRISLRNFTINDWLVFMGVAFFFAGDLSTWHIALHHTTVTNSLIIVNSTIFVVAIGAWVIYDEKPTKYLIYGAIIAFVGVLLLITGSAAKVVTTARETLIGDLLSCVTNLFYAGYLLQLRYARKCFSAVTIMIISNCFCALFLLIVALAFGEKIMPDSHNGWLTLISLALICQVGGQTLIAKGIEALPMGFSSMVLLNQVLVGAIASALILSEPITIAQIVGAGLLAVGIYWARPKKAEKTI